jgi:hypothetical protein
MNDDDLITALRKERRKVPMTTPLEQIISRSRAVRARRRIAGVAATLTAVTAGAVAVSVALPPASHPASSQPSHRAHAQLAAWTVSRQADGTVFVTIREFRDPAGLQRRLRADGVPASIISIQNRFNIKTYPCRQFNGGHWPDGELLKVAHLVDPRADDAFGRGLVIRPSALPRDAGIQFYITANLMTFLEGLVQVSPACTGS